MFTLSVAFLAGTVALSFHRFLCLFDHASPHAAAVLAGVIALAIAGRRHIYIGFGTYR